MLVSGGNTAVGTRRRRRWRPGDSWRFYARRRRRRLMFWRVRIPNGLGFRLIYGGMPVRARYYGRPSIGGRWRSRPPVRWVILIEMLEHRSQYQPPYYS